MQAAQQRVVVVGSVNMDEVVAVAALPAPGETVFGRELATGLGGKGANQAVAAAVAGGSVALVGAVGADARGAAVLGWLGEYGVDTAMVGRLEGTATGRALVVLGAGGENQIIVIGGANQALDGGLVAEALRGAAVMVLQGEIPVSVNRAALRSAAELGVRAVVNLAPVQELGGELGNADPLVVNEIEASQLIAAVAPLGSAGTQPAAAPPEQTARELTPALATVADVTEAAPRLRALARSVVVTLGAAGAVLITADAVEHLPAPRPERVRDTTGAGDALVGVLAAALAQGFGLRAAVECAVRAASLSVTEVGAAASYESFRSTT